MSFLRIATVFVLGLLACSSDDDEPPKNGNGVNDVRLACDIRLKWNRDAPDCNMCEAGAITPRCECSSLSAFSAVCSDQEEARKAACAESVTKCVNLCVRDDCACLDTCYADDARCKSASAARDGCVADACSQYCK